jgi:hypothetical protein
MDRHDETNNKFSHPKFILTIQKFQIQNISNNPLPHSTNHLCLEGTPTETPTQKAADTENRKILLGLQVAL